jgi:carboxylesterase
MLKVPGGAMFELGGLVSAVRERARGIQQPVLLVHPRHDDRASIHNSFWLQRNLAGTVDMVVLDDSYHVVTVDRQRHVVTDRTIAFAKTIEGAKDERISTVVEMPMGAGRRELSAA